MAKKYDLRTKQGKQMAQAEAGADILKFFFKVLFFPIKLIFKGLSK